MAVRLFAIRCAVLMAGILFPTLGNADTFRAIDGWRPTANSETARWQFGTMTTLGGPLTLFSLHGERTDVQYDWWSFDGTFFGPVMAYNGSGDTVMIPGTPDIVWPDDQLVISPGAKNGTPQHTSLRWIAPESGQYDIEGAFTDLQQSSVSMNVVVNGNSIFVDSLLGFTKLQGKRPFSLDNVFVEQGQAVDFVVSSGGDDGRDVLGISAEITNAVPEPSSVVLAGIGLLLVAGLRLYRIERQRRARGLVTAINAAELAPS
jgi:hypothetical protein